MDSVELKMFCDSKGFNLKEKKEDNWIYTHSYFSPADSSIWFLRTYPKGDKEHRSVYYYFTDLKTQNDFKKQMKKKGFKFKRKDEKDYGGNIFSHSIYLAEAEEIQLGTEKLIKQKVTYSLTYYRRVN